MQLARKVIKNSIYNSSRTIISGIGGLIFSIILARVLRPELFGIYALAMSICFFILQLDPGINVALTRYLSDAIGKKDELLGRSYFKFLFKLKILLAIIFSVSLAILAKPLSLQVFHKPELLIPLEIVSIFLVLYYFSDFMDACFQAFHDFKRPMLRHLIYESSKFVIVILFLLLGFSLFGVFVGITLAALITLLVMLSFLVKKYPHVLKGSTVKIDKKRLLRFLGFLTIGSVSGVFFAYIDMIMLGVFLPAEYVGYYKASANIVFGIAGLTAISGVLFPVFTQLEGEGLENAFRKVFKYSSVLSFPCAVGLIFLATPIVKVVYGSEYLPAVLPLMILSPLIIFNSVNFFGTLFTAKEKPEYTSFLGIFCAILNIVLNYILIIRYGIIGAASATLLSRFVNVFALGYLSKKVLFISPELQSIYKPFVASIVMFAFLYIIPRPSTIPIGIVEVVTAAVIYFATLFLIKGVGREDIRYFKLILGIERI